MLGDQQQDEFINQHRWAVLTTLRANREPSSSVVAYARQGDTLVVSTPGQTFKARSLKQNPQANLCIISNAEPFNFVTVAGRATVSTDDLVASTKAVFANIADTGYQEPEDLDGWLEAQKRVIIRLEAERVYGVIR